MTSDHRAKTCMGCEESSNNALATATEISSGDELSGVICPAGDVDYYKFFAHAGDRLMATVKASQLTPSSQLNTALDVVGSKQVWQQSHRRE